MDMNIEPDDELEEKVRGLCVISVLFTLLYSRIRESFAVKFSLMVHYN